MAWRGSGTGPSFRNLSTGCQQGNGRGPNGCTSSVCKRPHYSPRRGSMTFSGASCRPWRTSSVHYYPQAGDRTWEYDGLRASRVYVACSYTTPLRSSPWEFDGARVTVTNSERKTCFSRGDCSGRDLLKLLIPLPLKFQLVVVARPIVSTPLGHGTVHGRTERMRAESTSTSTSILRGRTGGI